ncbi:MAG TPA: SRPBCC domain-containing protein [Thermomicrobiaceae bacterium]|nr:SRPBCC domain-containing protein [Thermomicrobiaceae bacterium]
MPAVVRSIEIQAPPSAVWRWLATPESLRRWLSPTLEIDLRVGGAYRLPGAEAETWISGTVLELVPEGELILSWLEEGGDWVHPARLAVTLSPTTAGTRVTLTHDGFAGIGKPGWPATVEAYERGADQHNVLEQLADLVLVGVA